MWTMILTLAALAAATCVLLQPLNADQEAPAIVCPLISSPCAIDGIIESNEWSPASAFTGLRLFGKNTSAERHTTFWVMHDQRALYLAARVPLPTEAKPIASETQHDGAVWEDDAVEVFLAPSPSRFDYYHFIVNCAGVTYEAFKQDRQWTAPWDCKTNIAKDHWEVEMRIPFASLGVPTPKLGETWGFNVCSDRKTPASEISTWAPVQGSFHDPGNFGHLMFSGDSSRVQIESISAAASGHVSIKGNMLIHGVNAVGTMVIQRNGDKALATRREAPIGSPASLDWECDLPREKERPAPGNYALNIEVASNDGDRVFAKSTIPFRVEPPLMVILHPYYLMQKTLQVEIGTNSLNVPPGDVTLNVAIRKADGGDTVFNNTMLNKQVDRVPNDGRTTVEFNVANLPAGKYVLSAKALRRQNDALIVETTQPFEKPPTPKWFGSKAGITDEVLPPWKPIKVSGTTVEPWGRQYVYGAQPFPSRVLTRKHSMLTAPIRLVMEVDGKTMEVRGGKVKVTKQSPDVVCLSYSTPVGDLRFEEKVTVEYDGMMRHDFQFIPAGSVRIDSLKMEIPLATEHAKYLYYFPGGWGTAKNAGALPLEGSVSPFRPFIWLGDEDRGLAWFSESDQNWFNKDPNRAVEIVREGGCVLLRLNLISTPIELTDKKSQIADPKSQIQNLSYTFGLQATPVKPVVEDVWDMRIVHAGNYGIERQPYHGEATLTYPAEGNINLQSGTLEVWTRPNFDPNVTITDYASRGIYNRDFFAVKFPNGDMIDLYWNIDDRGLRFFVKEGERYPIFFGTHQDWKPGELHHVALTWGDAVCLYVDGQLVKRQPAHGTTERVLKDAQIVFGGAPCEFAIDEVRISDIARTEFDLTRPPVVDEHTLLLDHLDESFKPDGERLTIPAKAAGGRGGIATNMSSFAPVKFGNGLLLYQPGGSTQAKSYLDHLADIGVRTIVFHEHWTDLQNYPTTTHVDQLHSLVKACHEHGIKLLLYFGYLMADIAPEFPFYGDECLVAPRQGDYNRSPAQTDYSVCYRSPWQDFIADGLDRLIDEFDIDGVYLDGTEYPWGCQNVHHGCGYKRPDGTIGPTYTFFATRDMVRRIYAIVKKHKRDGLVNVHNSTCMTIPTLSWATSSWDGEQFGSMDRGPFALEVLPLDSFRCEFMGRQWGVPSEFLCYNRPYTIHEALSFTLLHDVLVREGEYESKLWRAMDLFGRKQAQFRPYWDNADMVTTNSPDIKASLWTRGAAGVMLVVSNLGKERQEASVTLNLQRLGLTSKVQAVDALDTKPIPLHDGHLDMTLDSLDWRMVWVK